MEAASRAPRRQLRARLAGTVNSLTTRVVAASAALAVMIAAIFTVLAFAVRDLSAAASRQSQAEELVADTVVLQKLVVDLETGIRGFVITGDERFLRPWENALGELEERLPAFVSATADEPESRAAAVELAQHIRDYRDEYLRPLIGIARDNPASARSRTARDEGVLRSEDIRERFTYFLGIRGEQAAATAASARAEARRAITIGLSGFAATLAMILLLGAYLTRSIARPVRQVAGEAKRIARGDLTVALDDRGPGEVGGLKRAFRAMAADLADRQRELEEQNARLRQSERLKSELVSMASHEIRTPLASILGFTRVLLQRDVSPEDRIRFLEIISAEATRLTALLDDFLDVQRLEDGPGDLEHDDVDVSALLRTQIALFSAESDKHWLELELPEEPLLVDGDASRLAQVFSNLISNAIKYSPDGGPVEVQGAQRDGVVHVEVRDRGFGIPAEARDRIFTKFFRGTAAVSGIPGSGLGLALARSVIEAHGGSIEFESRDGEGTTFSVRLPAGRPAVAEDASREVTGW